MGVWWSPCFLNTPSSNLFSIPRICPSLELAEPVTVPVSYTANPVKTSAPSFQSLSACNKQRQLSIARDTPCSCCQLFPLRRKWCTHEWFTEKPAAEKHRLGKVSSTSSPPFPGGVFQAGTSSPLLPVKQTCWFTAVLMQLLARTGGEIKQSLSE